MYNRTTTYCNDPPAFESEFNGPGVHLARDLFSGYNELAGVDGNLFVTGRSLQTGQPCNSQNLSGMIAFLWYSKENGRDINQQVGEYKEGTWALPDIAYQLGFAGVDMYERDVRNAGHVIKHD